MTAITTYRIAGLATLALATLPLAAVAGAARGAPAPARIVIADLDLNSDAGMAAFKDRARGVENTFCRDGKVLSTVRACRVAVRAEIADKLAQARQSQLVGRGTALASR